MTTLKRLEYLVSKWQSTPGHAYRIMSGDEIEDVFESLSSILTVVAAAKAWAWINDPNTMQEQELHDALAVLEEDV